MKWKHYPRYWSFGRGINWSPVNSPHKGQWHGALLFSLIFTWINGWVHSREAGDFRRHRAHYGVIVMNHIPERPRQVSPLNPAATMAPSSSTVSPRVELKRNFRTLHSMALVSSFIIGTGIYLGPTGVLQRITSPGLALIIWTIMGFVGIVDGLVYAEYATVFSRCGCSYLYMEIFYGPAIGFIQLWMYVLVLRPGRDAIKCLLVAT